MHTPRISIVVALGNNHAIGKNNSLLWHIPEDLKRFKRITMGHPIIMGRKTFESVLAILGKPMPGRTNIVVTRDTTWTYKGVMVTHSFLEALTKAKDLDAAEIFIGGGTEIYTQALPFVDRLYLTLIDDNQEGDSYFPDYQKEFTKELSREVHEWRGLRYQWVTLERG